MCGGDLIAEAGASYAVCDSCGSKQTIPSAADEQKANLYNRANHFRRAGEFDRAVTAYENILNADNTDAEAHWGLVLSRFGIEYVEDPATGERIPTCHRVQNESILADPDYKAALENAPDNYSSSLYEEEAKRIAELQRKILAIVANEQPYDVFICYKETTEGGSRTKDSAIAQDIYYALDKEGYRTFFSRISLEDKIGQEYEPYIFAALNSAKVMLVLGTEKEFFNAVWIKNEWSRFLALSKNDRSKLLIPCYRDMDPYDLPEELSMLQSQDMSKIGFIQDLLHGVEKVVHKTKADAAVSSAGFDGTSAVPGVDNLYKRAMLFLEDGDFDKADEYFDRILDLDSEYAPAYVGKVCSNLHIRKESDLGKQSKQIEYDDNFRKALRFANSSYKTMLNEYVTTIKNHPAELEKMRKSLPVSSIAIGKSHIAGLKNDGTVIVVGKDEAIINEIHNWENIIAISIQDDYYYGLRANGTVAVAMPKEYGSYDYSVNRWKDIIALSSGVFHTAGLKSDGTVVVDGVGIRKKADHRLEVKEWTDIKAIATSSDNTIGLKSNGTVVTTGNNRYGECNVSSWYDIVAISAGDAHTVGLKSDGTVVATGDNHEGQCNVQDWYDIVAIYTGLASTFGLKSDGTIVAAGRLLPEGIKNGCNWKDIVAVAEFSSVIGLKSDGTVVINYDDDENELDKLDISSMRGIRATLFSAEELRLMKDSAQKDSASKKEEKLKKLKTIRKEKPIQSIALGGSDGDFVVGIKSDGTVVAEGFNLFGQCNVTGFSNIIKVFCGEYCTVLLRADGTVVYLGSNSQLLNSVISKWEDVVDIIFVRNGISGLNSKGQVFSVSISDGRTYGLMWSDIVAIYASPNCQIGRKKDGTIISDNSKYCELNDWNDIADICAVYSLYKDDKSRIVENVTIYGLKTDGTVVACQPDSNTSFNIDEIANWADIINISAGTGYIIGLTANGTVVSTGNNQSGQCNVTEWNDIKLISATGTSAFGVKNDGTVVGSGWAKGRIEHWQNIVAIFKRGGTVVALCADGSVKYFNPPVNVKGFENISEWTNIRTKPWTSQELDVMKRNAAESRAKENELLEELFAAEREREKARDEKRKLEWIKNGKCRKCGGNLKGIFVKTCVRCGQKQ
jgi:alpha-tubulin suppressor-like RCC1 family protein/tetratricopeptide (TPR) repeat protein